jgi:DNA-directed RNA polymerase specialized sigma24 family protein
MAAPARCKRRSDAPAQQGPQKISVDEAEKWQDEPVNREYGEDDRNLLGSVDRVALMSAMEALPPGCRAIVVLDDIEGYEHTRLRVS